MENFIPSTTCLTGSTAVAAAAPSSAWVTKSTARHGSFGLGVRVVAPFAAGMQGTTVPSARLRTVATATALFPMNEIAVTDDASGIRSWSPPV